MNADVQIYLCIYKKISEQLLSTNNAYCLLEAYNDERVNKKLTNCK